MKRIFTLILALRCMLPFIGMAAYSETADVPFTAKEFTAEEATTLWNNIKLTPLSISKEDLDSPIVDFDISPSGNILLVLKNDQLVLLNAEGTVQKAYSFKSYGSVCAGFSKDNIQLFWVRSHALVEFTTEGTLVQILEIDSGDSETAQYIRQLEKTSPIEFEDKEYRLKRSAGFFDIVSSSYSQLIVCSDTGAQTVLYDAGASHTAAMIPIFLLIVSVFVIAGIKVARQFKNFKKENSTNKTTAPADNG